MSKVRYQDLCTHVLLRMGEEAALGDGKIEQTEVVNGYLKAIPVLLREGLALLATAGKYAVLSIEAQQLPGQALRLDLKEAAPLFYSLAGRQLYLNGEKASGYRLEEGDVLCADAPLSGTWRIYYNAYPGALPDPIGDDYLLELDEEVYALLPLYIEGRLRLIADEEYASTILSEFEQRRAELRAVALQGAIGARVVRLAPEEGGLGW